MKPVPEWFLDSWSSPQQFSPEAYASLHTLCQGYDLSCLCQGEGPRGRPSLKVSTALGKSTCSCLSWHHGREGLRLAVALPGGISLPTHPRKQVTTWPVHIIILTHKEVYDWRE